MSILTTDKITEIFCITDDFCKEFSKEMEKAPLLPEPGKRHRNRPCGMSNREIITILMLCYRPQKPYEKPSDAALLSYNAS
jgi:hypothetical protein